MRSILTSTSSNELTTNVDKPSTYGPRTGCSRTLSWKIHYTIIYMRLNLYHGTQNSKPCKFMWIVTSVTFWLVLFKTIEKAVNKDIYKPLHDKTNKMTCAPSEDSDQPGHPPSLISVFAVCMKKHWALNYLLSAQRRLWSDWADAQADLSLPWAHMSFC